jgi:hypothetical protein
MSRQVKLNRAVATYPLPVVAYLLGIGRNAGYDAADDEVFPTIRVRGRVVAVAAAINRLLELSGHDDPRVRAAYELAGFELPALEVVVKGESAPPPRKVRRRAAAPSISNISTSVGSGIFSPP